MGSTALQVQVNSGSREPAGAGGRSTNAPRYRCDAGGFGLRPSSGAESLQSDGEAMKTPFNSQRVPALPPYHLRNGLSDRAEAETFEAEHRRHLGMRTAPHCETCTCSHPGKSPADPGARTE